MKKHILTTLTICFVLITSANAQTNKFLDTLQLGIRYQVQEFHTLNQKLDDNCNCDESLRLNERALQSINASIYEPLTNRWSVGADLGGAFGTIMNDHRAYTKYSFVQLRVESFYHLFNEKSKLRPYLSGSVQFLANNNKSFVSLPLGAGLRYQLLKGGSLHVQTAYDSGFSHLMSKNMITQVGFNVPLFKRKKANTDGNANFGLSDASTKGSANANWSAQAKNSTSGAANTANTGQSSSSTSNQASATASVAQNNTSVPNAAQNNSPAAVESKKGLARIIYFDTDKNSLNKANTDRVLAEVYEFLIANKDVHVYLYGHTDNVQTEAYNMQLSKSRVAALTAWLVQKGIDASRIHGKHYGESSPVASNDYESGRAANRRVEIIIK